MSGMTLSLELTERLDSVRSPKLSLFFDELRRAFFGSWICGIWKSKIGLLEE